ncbi:MAG: sigma 54-interacting transcriptional regulator, partial [Myxococcota bacterium]
SAGTSAHAVVVYDERLHPFDIGANISTRGDVWNAIRRYGPSEYSSGTVTVGRANWRVGYSYAIEPTRAGTCSFKTLKVDVRVIAATHRDLPAMVTEKTFREDLYFRLRVLDIRLPPLRERGEDLEALARHFLGKVCQRLGRPLIRLRPDALAAIRAHAWPGNVRELENAIERAVILSDGEELEAHGLGIEVPTPVAADDGEGTSAGQSLTDYFRTFVETHQSELSETEIAKRLGISRKALWERRRKLGIPRPK